MIGEPFLQPVQPFIALPPLVQYHVYDFVVFADILRWGGHNAVDNVTEEADVSLCIVSYAVHQVCDGFLKLNNINMERRK